MSDSAVVAPGVGGTSGPEPGPAGIAPPASPRPRRRFASFSAPSRLSLARIALAAASGFVLYLAFPGIDLWPLAPVGVAGLAIATRGVGSRFGALLGLVFGTVFFLRLIPWIGIFVGAFPWIALSVVEALYLAAMGALLPLAWRARGGLAGLLLASGGLWVAQEAVRGRWPFGGFPWGRLAFSQADAPTAALASIGGAPLVSFAVAVAGTLLAWAVVRLWQLRKASWAAAGAVVAGLAVIGVGALIPLPTSGESTTRVAAVQGNVPRIGLDFNAQRRAVLDNHVQATLELAERVAAGQAEQPDVVLWPENASDIDPYINADAAAEISAATDAIGVPILIGAVVQGPGENVSNTGIVWRPGQGAGTGQDSTYVKRHPAPFAEYIPYRDFFRNFSKQVDLVRRDFISGDELRDNPVGVMRMGVDEANPVLVGDVICFEVAYDGLVRDSVRQGATLLAVQTNNATFGYTDESVQQLAQSRLRAIEHGRSTVNISTVGVSGIILPDGTVVERSGHYTQEVLEASVPLRTSQTIATRVGEWPEWILTGLALALLIGSGLAVRRGKQSS